MLQIAQLPNHRSGMLQLHVPDSAGLWCVRSHEDAALDIGEIVSNHAAAPVVALLPETTTAVQVAGSLDMQARSPLGVPFLDRALVNGQVPDLATLVAIHQTLTPGNEGPIVCVGL